MPQFEPGHSIGADTRFKPGQSGNPGGRPKGLSTIARKVLSEAAASGGATKGEAVIRKLYEMAVEGNVQAIKVLLDREWPMPSRHEMSRDAVPMVVLRDYTGGRHENREERLIPSTVEEEPEATSESVVRAPGEPQASGWDVRRPDDEERDTTAVL